MEEPNISLLNIILFADKVVEIVYCPTELMIADILTRGLTQVKFERLREMIGVKQPDHK